jgi:hypothetical protein
MSGMPRVLLRKVCNELASIGWMRLDSAPRLVRPIALIPHCLQARAAKQLEEQFMVAPNKGEFLTKCLLDFYIDSDHFVDNARPAYLRNPVSGQPLEYDRIYLHERVAVEFNGWQHYGPTEMFPDEKEIQEAKARDLMKKALSSDNGIRLVIVTPAQIVPEEFVKLLPAELPRNHVDEDGPYFKALARLCEAYHASALAGRDQRQAAQRKPDAKATAPVKQGR